MHSISSRSLGADRCLAIGGLLCWLGIVAAIAGTAFRIVKQYHEGGLYDAKHGGMADFHNGAYHSALAIRDGVSPYGNDFAKKYPVAKPNPAFSPSILALHIPIAMLPQRIADLLYFILSIVLLGWIAWLATIESIPDPIRSPNLRGFLFPFLCFFILASRGGHTTLLNGYFTPIIVLGIQLALQFCNRRPWLAGFGYFLASGKPTFAIPLLIVMFARGNYRALSIGVLLGAIGGLLPLCWLAWNLGWGELVSSITDGQKLHMADPRELPINTWTRIDLSAIAAKWSETNPSEILQVVAMIPMIAIPAWALHRRRRSGDTEGTISLSGSIALLALLVTLYHHVYDALILIGPIAILSTELLERLVGSHKAMKAPASLDGPSMLWRTWSSFSILCFGILISTPWWNYLSSEILLTRLPNVPLLHRLLTSVNATALSVALVLLVMFALKRTANANISSDVGPPAGRV